MAPWEGIKTDDGVARGGERALSFISKSISEAQRSAQSDMKLMKSRVQSFIHLSATIDKEWESLKKSSRSFNDATKGFDSALQNFLVVSKGGGSSTSVGGLAMFSRNPNKPPSTTNTTMKVEVSGGVDKSMLVRKDSSQQEWKIMRKLNTRGDNESNWEPLQRVKRTVHRSLGEEIDTTTATATATATAISKSPPVEFLENVKKNLETQDFFFSHELCNRTPVLDMTWKRDETSIFLVAEAYIKSRRFKSFVLSKQRDVMVMDQNDTLPLSMPELLEKFAGHAEPLLDQLGLKKDGSKVGDKLRSCKHKVDQLSSTITVKGKELGLVGKALAGDLFSKGLDDLDHRIGSVVQGTGYRNKEGLSADLAPARQATVDSRRSIAIVTTASLPWMTGTAVNPLLRAAYLAKSGQQNVTLLVPWLCKKDQEQVYPNRMTFDSPAEQETFVRGWLENRVGFRPDFKIAFYPGKFSTEKRSILAAGDISQFIPDQEADVAVLEEPEHLTWYYHGKRWTDKFQHVVGIVHTNYLEYVKREKNGKLQAFLLKHVNNWVVRIYCNKVLRLSAATQALPRSSVCNVHGVSPKFLDIGKQLANESENSKARFSKGAYYLGKMVWGKGYRELVDLLAQNKDVLDNTQLDVFGTGEDSQAVRAAAQQHGLRMNFHEGRDHADDLIHGYKVFINPSLSDVVCTTTAEALAMGKLVVCADHPSNDFFRPFPNCLMYQTPDEFVEKVKLALASDPIPLSPGLQHLLSWEAATERFINCAELDKLPPRATKGTSRKNKILSNEAANGKTMALSLSMPDFGNILDRGLAFAHYFASGIEVARLAAGALPGTMHMDEQHRKDLGLPVPAAKSFYHW